MNKMLFEYVVKSAEWCGTDRRQLKWVFNKLFNLPFTPYVGLIVKDKQGHEFTVFDLKTGHHDITLLHWDEKDEMFKFSITDVPSKTECDNLVKRLKAQGYYLMKEPKPETKKEIVLPLSEVVKAKKEKKNVESSEKCCEVSAESGQQTSKDVE